MEAFRLALCDPGPRSTVSAALPSIVYCIAEPSLFAPSAAMRKLRIGVVDVVASSPKMRKPGVGWHDPNLSPGAFSALSMPGGEA